MVVLLLIPSTHAAEAPAPARWQIHGDGGWQDYTADMSAELERIFQTGRVFHGHTFWRGHRQYILQGNGHITDDGELVGIVQIRLDFNTERPVRRLSDGPAVAAGPAAAARPAAATPAPADERFALSIVNLEGNIVATIQVTSAMTVQEVVERLQHEAGVEIMSLLTEAPEPIYLRGDFAIPALSAYERAGMAQRTLGWYGISSDVEMQAALGTAAQADADADADAARHPGGWEVLIAEDSEARDEAGLPLAGRWVAFETTDGTDLDLMVRDERIHELEFTNRFGRYILRRGSFDPDQPSDFHQILFEDDVARRGWTPEAAYNDDAKMMLVRRRA